MPLLDKPLAGTRFSNVFKKPTPAPAAPEPTVRATPFLKPHSEKFTGPKSWLPTDRSKVFEDSFARITKPLDKWLGTKTPPEQAVSSGENAYGDKMIRNGVADPEAYTDSLRPERNNPLDAGEKVSRPLGEVQPTSPLERVSRIFVESGDSGLTPEEDAQLRKSVPPGSSQEAPIREIARGVNRVKEGWGGVLTAGQMVNDVNSRIANLRKWWIDDPMKEGDSPGFLYTGKNSGKEYRGPTGAGATYDPGDVIDYWKLDDGTVLSTQDIRKASQNPVFDGADNFVGFRLSPDKVVSSATLSSYQPDIRAFEDGTVFALPDGSTPPDMQPGGVPRRQANPGLGNMGVKDPRQPWQSKSGDTIFDPSFWARVAADDRQVKNPLDFVANAVDNVKDTYDQSAINEIAPWFTDMSLSSAPYMFMSLPYAKLSAAASTAPYWNGYNGDTAQPTGRFLDNLGDIGNTRYAKGDLTNSQRVGGLVEGPAAQYVERMSGDVIGGFENLVPQWLPKTKKFFGENPAGHLLGGGIMEGPVEEGLGVIPSMVKEEPWQQIGKTQTGVNDETGAAEYDEATPRFGTFWNNLRDVSLAGGLMGFGYDALPSAKMAFKNRFDRRNAPAPAPVPVKIPVNRKRTQAELDAEMRSLERRYGEDEE